MADSTNYQFVDGRLTDVNGTNYLVVKRTRVSPAGIGRFSISFVIATKKPGSSTVKEARDAVGRLPGTIIRNPDVAVRSGDTVHSRGALEVGIPIFLVSSGSLGFAVVDLLDEPFAWPPKVNAVTVVSRDGLVRHRIPLTSLFSEHYSKRITAHRVSQLVV